MPMSELRSIAILNGNGSGSMPSGSLEGVKERESVVALRALRIRPFIDLIRIQIPSPTLVRVPTVATASETSRVHLEAG